MYTWTLLSRSAVSKNTPEGLIKIDLEGRPRPPWRTGFDDYREYDLRSRSVFELWHSGEHERAVDVSRSLLDEFQAEYEAELNMAQCLDRYILPRTYHRQPWPVERKLRSLYTDYLISLEIRDRGSVPDSIGMPNADNVNVGGISSISEFEGRKLLFDQTRYDGHDVS